jgi:hypothetical protein
VVNVCSRSCFQSDLGARIHESPSDIRTQVVQGDCAPSGIAEQELQASGVKGALIALCEALRDEEEQPDHSADTAAVA